MFRPTNIKTTNILRFVEMVLWCDATVEFCNTDCAHFRECAAKGDKLNAKPKPSTENTDDKGNLIPV